MTGEPPATWEEAWRALWRLPLAAMLASILALRPRRRGTPPRRPRGHSLADHPCRRRRARDARRRHQPRARVRHRRRCGAGAVSRQGERSEGRRRDAVDARDRVGDRRRAMAAGDCRHGVPGGASRGDRVLRASRYPCARDRGEGREYRGHEAAAGAPVATGSDQLRAQGDVSRRAPIRGAMAGGPTDGRPFRTHRRHGPQRIGQRWIEHVKDK